MIYELNQTNGRVMTSCIVVVFGLYLGYISTTGSKTQTIRLLDVFVIGPLMMYFGHKSKPASFFSMLLIFCGATTITYNLRNYLLINMKNENKYPYPYTYRIKSVTKVIDGDTIDAVIDLGFNKYVTKRIRLATINAPELHLKAGLESKEFLKKTLEGAKNLIIKTDEYIDIYGRVVGSLFDGEISIENKMIAEGYAKSFRCFTLNKHIICCELESSDSTFRCRKAERIS